MKSLHIGLQPVVFSFAMLATLAATVFGITSPGIEESAAETKVTPQSPAIPQAHQAYLEALKATRKLDYRKHPADTCVKDLSRTLGITIRLDKTIRDRIHKRRTINFTTKEPVSHQTALRLVMQQFGVRNYGLVFEKDHILLVTDGKYDGPQLRTYDLAGRSNYSTAERRRIIEATLTQVHPKSWTAANKTWIRDGESVFDIDVYQRQDVHNIIQTQLINHFTHAAIDPDIQRLSGFAFLMEKKTSDKIDKEAIVKRLRKRYQFESMADRLKYESNRKQTATPLISEAAEKQIRESDKVYEARMKSKSSYIQMRSDSLQLLHESEVNAFISRPGAGLTRMPPAGPSYLSGNPPPGLSSRLERNDSQAR